MVSRRGLEFEGIDPNDKSGVQVRTYTIEQWQIEELRRYDMASKLQRIRCVPLVLKDPFFVFEGWNREGFEKCLVFVGRPRDWTPAGVEVPPQPGRHFMIYVMPDGRIKEWGWDVFDPNSETMVESQFGKDWVKKWP